MRSRRSRKLSEQLPDALDMMARSLRAGHALSSAFKMVATEMPAPISLEFARAFEEQNLGLPFERAIAQMTKRAPDNRDLKIFAVSVIVQKETGGNLVEIIEKIAETIRAALPLLRQAGRADRRGPHVELHPRRAAHLHAASSCVHQPALRHAALHHRRGPLLPVRRRVMWVVGFVWMRRMTKVTI